MTGNMRAALDERADLIEKRADVLVKDAVRLHFVAY